MRPKFLVRKAGPQDVGRAAPLFDAYRRFYRQPSDPAGAKRFLAQRLRNEESVVFLAVRGTIVLGFTQLYPTFSSVSLRRLWILNDLFVLPEARRQGVAEALMARAARLAGETGAEGLVLETAVDNLPAQTLYERLGWKREKKFYRYNLDI